jgi:large subunit ribosomal protein L24
MLKIKKSDIVQVIKGKDKGKKGKVITVFASQKRVLVEGMNVVKKHKRQTRQDEKGGIISIEKPLDISSLMLVCKHCSRPVRVGFSITKDGVKNRICKACKEVI